MANTTAIKGTRPAQLIRTDDSVPGVVSFYDRREADVEKALIGSVEVPRMGLRDDEPDLELNACVARAAVHGVTQNILDASNKLEGDARVAFIRRACDVVKNGGWASAPVDEAAAVAKAVKALMALGMDRDEAERIATQRV